MADPLVGGAPASSPSPAPGPAASPSAPPASVPPSPAPSAVSSSGAAGGGGVAGAAPASSPGVGGVAAGAGAPAGESGLRDSLRELGLGDLATQYADDHGALQQLVLAYRQLQQVRPYVPYAQQYAQYAAPFQQWLAQQQAQQQAAAQAKKSWFGLPEYDPRWRQMVSQNPQTGEYTLAPGAPPDVLQKLHSYAYALSDLQNRFWSDPEGTLGPLVEHIAEQKARALMGAGLGGYQEQVQAQGFVDQNSDWLHQHDGQGRVVRDPASGQLVLSEWGRRFAAYVQQAEQAGVRGVVGQRDYALGMLQRDALAAQYQQQQAQQQGDLSRQQFLQQAAGGVHNPSPGGSVQPPSPNGNGPSQQPSLNLRERLNRKFKESGYQVPETIPGTR